MDLNQRKEQFSQAFLRAVAAVAGYSLFLPTVDHDSIDWTMALRGGGGTVRSPKLDIQLKCTGRDVVRPRKVVFPLEVKNYEELRPTNFQVPRILVVVVVPEEIGDWVKQTHQQLAMRHCGYWLSLTGFAPTSNTETVSVSIPKSHRFTAHAVQEIMDRVGDGGLP